MGSLTLCVNVLEELEEVLSLLQGVRGEINVWHNWRSHDCRDGSQAEEDLGKHLDVFEKSWVCEKMLLENVLEMRVVVL